MNNLYYKNRSYFYVAITVISVLGSVIFASSAASSIEKSIDVINSENTICIVRGSVARRDAYLDLISQLEKLYTV